MRLEATNRATEGRVWVSDPEQVLDVNLFLPKLGRHIIIHSLRLLQEFAGVLSQRNDPEMQYGLPC